jgi:hypothetical protein
LQHHDVNMDMTIQVPEESNHCKAVRGNLLCSD